MPVCAPNIHCTATISSSVVQAKEQITNNRKENAEVDLCHRLPFVYWQRQHKQSNDESHLKISMLNRISPYTKSIHKIKFHNSYDIKTVASVGSEWQVNKRT